MSGPLCLQQKQDDRNLQHEEQKPSEAVWLRLKRLAALRGYALVAHGARTSGHNHKHCRYGSHGDVLPAPRHRSRARCRWPEPQRGQVARFPW